MERSAISEPAEPSLDELARSAAQGDTTSLETLLAQIQPRVMRLCMRMLPCREDAEEACQDAMLRVALKIDTFRGQSKFTTWLHTVAGNSARQTYRSLKRRAAERPTDQMPTHADPRTTSVIAGSRLDLLEALETLERDRPELVEVLVMRDVAELDYAEIARQLNAPLGTVKSRIHDARLKIRPLLLIKD
ncbi:MAG: RNA polymerase sigma factor [Nocardioidaceae bacterium]